MARHHSQSNHDTDVRRRRGLWIATCSCGWSEEVVSGFAGWAASRRHLDEVRGTAPESRRTPGDEPQVRIIEEHRPRLSEDDEGER